MTRAPMRRMIWFLVLAVEKAGGLQERVVPVLPVGAGGDLNGVFSEGKEPLFVGAQTLVYSYYEK